jgi:glycosyltransferase involved in cell wall biosynthesis
VIKFTGVAPEKIDVVYGGVDESFLPLPKGEVERTISNLGISAPYIFGVSGFHHTKNLRRLLEAYSLLPETLRQQFHLVVLCPLSHQAREIVHGWLANLEIQDRVTFLQGVRQQQMVALYNGATVVVHPTLYEGLGLPILEAMRCGTPVVASNAASMPEIAGEAARLVDPYDPEDIARGMAQVLASPTLQTELRERGFQQAASFTWERTAVTVLESFVKAAETAQTRPPVASVNSFSRRFKISFWSPLNPRPSGVSDYSELLLAELGKCADVHLFLDGYQPSNLALFDLFPTFDSRAFPYISHRHSYDIILYQVGNNPLHRYMYRPILDWPGIVTFHDVCIYHFIHAVLALGGNPEEFWQEVAYSEGPEVVKKARVDYLKGTLDDYLLLLNKRLVTASRGVITHSEWAAKQLQKHNGTPPIRVIPHGMLFLEDEGMRFGRLVRQLLGLPEKGFVFGVFGNLHRVKRLPVVLRAFARVHKEYPETGLFIMGRVDPSAIGDIDPLQQDPQAARAQGIHLYLAYASYELMLMAMQAVNVAINLRYPTAGETSGSLSTLLGFGKPTIVSAVGSFTEYPDDCCPKIPIDDNEEDTLFRHMLGVVKDESHYRRAVRCAYEYSRNRTWSHCAQGYLDFIEEVLSDHHSSQ